LVNSSDLWKDFNFIGANLSKRIISPEIFFLYISFNRCITLLLRLKISGRNFLPLQEALCLTDPDNALAERRIGGGSDGDAEDDHRMMASTTVFVIEPGFTAVGKVYHRRR
jgi:hypothetical protein